MRLEKREGQLALITSDGRDLRVDLVNDRTHYQKKSRGKQELIAKATGLSKKSVEIWDLTAGLLEDSWFLVQLGARVKAFERNEMIGALLQDAIERAGIDSSTQAWAQRIELKRQDSIPFLKQIPDQAGPEVIYLDPMFQFSKKKSALPRKEMQIFRELIGPDSDFDELFQESCRVAKERVVIKRPLKEKPLFKNPMHSFLGTSIRFDVYRPFTKDLK